MAASRAPRRPRTTPFTRSRCRNAPLRPRLVLMPSDSISMTASKSLRGRSRVGVRAGARARTDRPPASPRRRPSRRSAAPGRRAASSGTCRRSSSPVRIDRTSAAHSTSSSRVVAKMPPLGLRRVLDLMPGSADPLQCDRDRSRRADLADEIDRADVDAELERRRGDDGLELAGLELLFGFSRSLRDRLP